LSKDCSEKQNALMEQRLTLITLGVADLKKSTAFYIKMFGWQKSPSSNDYISFFTLNGIQLALFERAELAQDADVSPEGNGFKGFTLAYNTRTKEEVDVLIENLRKNGVVIIKHPKKAIWGGYSGYVSDLDGNLWEIAYNPYLVMNKDGNI
jgi:predicted lactoylglutathione lyase